MSPPPAVRGIYRTDARARAAYSEAAGIYRILPQAVCLPADTDDLRLLIRWAAEQRTSLVPRGAGSAMGGGNVGEGVIVDLAHLGARRLEVDGPNRRAITSAGVTLSELNDAAYPHGLRLPPDPSSGRWASLGGMVATNAAGARSVRYGSVRPWVEALTVITAEGDVVTLRRGTPPPESAALARFNRDAAPAIASAAALIAARFPHTRKNSSGYALDAYLASGDVLDLFIGGEGTLGIVTEIEWRLDSIPACRAGLRVWLGSLEEIGPAVAALAPAEPSAVELLDRSFLELVGAGTLSEAGLHSSAADAVLLVELERDDDQSLAEALERAASAVRPIALSIETAISGDAADRLWAIRHAASPILSRLPEERRSLQVIEDGCVPVARLSEYIRAVRRAAIECGIPAVMFGHAGDGHLHVNLLPEISRPGWEAVVARVMDIVTEAIVQLGGTLSGEHGDGRLRATALARVYGPEIFGLFRRIKQDFDPMGVFNPGVILPASDPPISRLKVGASAVSLPPDLQRSLREIEQTGGYATSRLDLADARRGTTP
jgi:FAD/FMN-containing dehydrogenase